MLPQSVITPAPPAVVQKATPPEEQAIVKNEQYSVRQFSPNAWGGFIGDSMGWIFPSTRGLLGMWGTLECDQLLRAFHYREMNGLWGGAVKIWIEKFLGTPYEISGGRNQTYQWQDIFFEADFGEGYDYMMSKFLLDYLTLNRGGFLEKVGYGESDTPLYDDSKVIGLNHLDALRIYFTGNREYPYLYQSEWTGGLHKLHYSRVVRVVAQPSANTLMFGMGKSALYDSILVANAQTLIATQQNELLNDMPPPGVVLFNNVRPDQVEDAMKQFKYDNIRDGHNVYRAPIKLESFDTQNPATVTFIPVRTLPPDYDFEKYTLTNVNILALTIGLDPQDIWPLQSKVMGSGQQSEVLAKKSESRGPGYLLTKMERIWNTVLPRSLEWKYKAQNTEQDKQIADTAKQWNDMVASAAYLSVDEKRQLMANQVPSVAEVIADEQGVARLFDDDPKTTAQITATDVTEVDTPTLGAEDTIAQDNTPLDNTTQGNQLDAESEPVKASALALSAVNKPATAPPTTPLTNKPPAISGVVNDTVNNAFKTVGDQLKAGLLTLAQAQEKLGLERDPLYEGLYLIEGFPVPREKIRELWQAHFGRGVASFDAVVSGETIPTGNGSGPVPQQSSDQTSKVLTLPANIMDWNIGQVQKFFHSQRRRKNIDDTGSAYTDDIYATVQDAMAKTITKAGAASRIRGAIIRYGKQAFMDGLEDGGVDPNELDDEDKATIADDNVKDSQYVTDFVNEIYSETGLQGDPRQRADLWISTLNRFYYDGIASADKNGMYKFVGDDGVENCRTCHDLKGQVHRMKDWVRHELRPGLDHHNFECGTWEPNCAHYLEKTDERANGNWA